MIIEGYTITLLGIMFLALVLLKQPKDKVTQGFGILFWLPVIGRVLGWW